MATYKEIKGVTVQTRDEDPVVNAGSWSSGGSLNNIRYGAFGFGIQTAAIVATGSSPPFSPSLAPVVEQYNGTSWTEIADVNQTRNLGGAAGTVTEGLIFGGTPGSHNETEDWNGSAWTEVNNLNTGRQQCSGNGTGTAAIAVAGYTTANVNNVETWDGTNWTETTENNTSRRGLFGVGPYTGTIVFGGKITNTSALAETWDGSSWTETGDLNQARTLIGGSGSSSTDGLAFGGATGPTSGSYANTENWNGSAWTEVADLATARQAGASAGTSTSALFSSGTTDGGSTIPSQSEEWSFPPVTQAKLKEGMIFLSGGTTLKGFGKAAGIPAGTWASGTDMPTANRSQGMFGPSTSTIIGGGYEPGTSSTNAYSWNGSSWSDIAELNANKNEGVGFGNSSTSGFINKGTNEEWDGSSWTERNDLNTTRVLAAAAGSTTAALITGGEVNPSAVTESWDGTSWTEVGDTNEGRYGAGLSGTQTSAIFATGVEYPGGSKTANAETWNGSSWTEGNNVNESRVRLGYSSKGVSIAMIFAGENASNAHSANTEIYNGTSWTEINNMSTARRSVAAGISGSASSGSLAIGGNPPTVATVEEWSVDNALGTITFS